MTNDSSDVVYLNIGNIQAKLNGEPSSATHYDSLASVIPVEQKLEQGSKSWELYLVYSANLRDKAIKQFEVINFGLRSI